MVTLEEEIAQLAESVGRGDAEREQELEIEVARLRELLDKSQAHAMSEDENIAYVRITLW